MGIALTLVFVWLAGAIGSNVVGKRLIGHRDDFISNLPLIGSIYSPVKQFINNVASAKQFRSFKRIILAEYPADDR